MTGFLFRYQQYSGIITCLHGVSPGRTYMAEGMINSKNNLSVRFVDVEQDLAFLTADHLKDESVILKLATLLPGAGKKLKVLGYPAGMMDINEHTASVGNPNLKVLGGMIPADAISFLDARKSPALNIKVLYIEGPMVPGHSGAPVFDEYDRVCAVIDGGVMRGAAGITWAIPIGNIKWTDISTPGIVDKINRLTVSNGKNAPMYDFVIGEDSTKNKQNTFTAANFNGTWNLSMKNCYNIDGNDTPLGGHWTSGGMMILELHDDNTVTGRFSTRVNIYCKEAEVTGKLEGNRLELTIECDKGGCSGKGFTLSLSVSGKKFIGSNAVLPNRPSNCILPVSKEVTLEQR
jgi:hypothetical protein